MLAGVQWRRGFGSPWRGLGLLRWQRGRGADVLSQDSVEWEGRARVAGRHWVRVVRRQRGRIISLEAGLAFAVAAVEVLVVAGTADMVDTDDSAGLFDNY